MAEVKRLAFKVPVRMNACGDVLLVEIDHSKVGDDEEMFVNLTKDNIAEQLQAECHRMAAHYKALATSVTGRLMLEVSQQGSQSRSVERPDIRAHRVGA